MSDLGCSCVCNVDDYEPAGFYHVQTVKARKVHRCCECGAEISKGEVHEVVSGIWEGDWDRHRTCTPCVRIRDDLCSCGFGIGMLRQTIWDELGFDYVTGEESKHGWWRDR